MKSVSRQRQQPIHAQQVKPQRVGQDLPQPGGFARSPRTEQVKGVIGHWVTTCIHRHHIYGKNDGE
ncbi:MAG: hypothetical protein KIT22_00905 [Verrucomicrobiae bacterium]|nr:hypothetical protein [Verrucomicrobiae bacterium]